MLSMIFLIAAIMAVRYQQYGEYRIARNVPEARSPTRLPVKTSDMMYANR
jgi:hypothetical protein